MQLIVTSCLSPRLRKIGLVSALILLTPGCATLPSSGPTGSQIVSASQKADDALNFPIVELDSLQAIPLPPARADIFLPSYIPPPTNLIGTGDELEVAIYEAGVRLFGGASGGSDAGSAAAQSGAQVARLPTYRVDDKGDIEIPFAGSIHAAGRTTTELERTIRAALKGLSENPQVLVTIRESVTNSLIIGGEVGKPGRLVLATNRESLSDAIALAGGYRGDAKDVAVRVQRDNKTITLRLSSILSGSDSDFPVYPGDRITILRQPLTFSAMGAPGRVQQITFPSPAVSLAEAVALSGGSDANLGDPKAIFLFRFVVGPDGTEKPIVYHLNMMKAGAYFISQRFVMQDKDLLYIGNAQANQPAKFIQIISQLFTPVVLARQLTQ